MRSLLVSMATVLAVHTVFAQPTDDPAAGGDALAIINARLVDGTGAPARHTVDRNPRRRHRLPRRRPARGCPDSRCPGLDRAARAHRQPRALPGGPGSRASTGRRRDAARAHSPSPAGARGQRRDDGARCRHRLRGPSRNPGLSWCRGRRPAGDGAWSHVPQSRWLHGWWRALGVLGTALACVGDPGGCRRAL